MRVIYLICTWEVSSSTLNHWPAEEIDFFVTLFSSSDQVTEQCLKKLHFFVPQQFQHLLHPSS